MRKAFGGLVIALCVAALAGASRTGTYQGGSYGQAGATYQAGGVADSGDTITIVFTPQDVLTSDSNPATIDTSLVWGRTPNTFASPATRDFARRVLFTQRLAGADSVYRLGTGYAVPNFCWGAISSTDTSGCANGTNPKLFGPTRVTTTVGGSPAYVIPASFPPTDALANTNADGGRSAHLFYIPFGARLPDNCTVVSATLSVVNAGNSQFTYSDSLYAVLMTNAADDDWYTTKDSVDWPNYPNMAHASWMRQESTNGGGWWNGTNRWIWNPALANRPYYWSWGSVCDWSGSRYGSESAGEYSLSYIPTKTGYDIDVTNCVQAAVNGTTNNGIIIMNAESGATTNDWAIYGWDQYGDAKGREPYLVIKYITKKYAHPFGSADWAFVASTDDGKYPANRAYADTFKAHGGKYSLFMAQNQLSASGGSSPRQFVQFRTLDGMEVGSHSREHRTTYGLRYWEQQGMPDTLVANGDPDGAGPKTVADDTMWTALKRDAQPRWLYAMADSIVGDLRGDPLFAKSLALPENQIGPAVQLALEKLGYESVRYKSLGTLQDSSATYWVQSTFRPAKCDTYTLGGVGATGRKPRNMVVLPTSMGAERVFGDKAKSYTSSTGLDSIRHNLRRLIYQVKGQKSGVVSLFWHDFKDNPSAAGYAEGVNAKELGAALDVVDEMSGRYMTVSEYVRWMQGTGTALDYPWSTAKPDTFRQNATQRIWVRPYGIDTSWIRNVK